MLAFCVAVSNKNKLDQLNIFSEEAVLEPGYSGNSVATGNRSGSHQAIMKTGVISLTLDSMVYDYDFPCPNHIKIDVDGHEDKILSGSERVLKNKTLKTVLIECEYSNSALIDKFIEHGFERYEDFKSPLYKEYLINHNKDDMGNIVFIRKQ